MTNHLLHRSSGIVGAALVAVGVISTASPALAQNSASRALDSVLRSRARQLTGRSRVIVEYRDTVDVRAVTAARGRAGRRLGGGRLQIADIDNIGLATLASDPRVAR